MNLESFHILYFENKSKMLQAGEAERYFSDGEMCDPIFPSDGQYLVTKGKKKAYYAQHKDKCFKTEAEEKVGMFIYGFDLLNQRILSKKE